MGNSTSSPLVSNEELSGDIATATDRQDNNSHHSESCWRFLVRKIYDVFGLDYQPLQDTPNRRKRRMSEMEPPGESEAEEENGDDVERSHKTPRLTDSTRSSLHSNSNSNTNSRKDKNLEQQDVCVNIVRETMKHSVKAPGEEAGASDITIDPVPVETKDVDATTTAPVEFMDFTILTNEEARQYLRRSWTMLIIRGLPGSGKSTIARQLEETYPGSVSCSADQFFLNTDTGEYQFDRSQLGQAHKWCQNKAEEACRARVNIVIVDNTNIKKWEMVPYFKLANKYRYSVVLVEPRTPWRFNIDELARRNRHGVDRFLLSKKVTEWEVVRAQYYGWFLSVPDSRLLLERAREVMEQCLSQAGEMSRAQLYSRDNISSGEKCHCTAQFVRKADQDPVEVERLGEVSRLTIAGFIITPRTLGARVVLSQSQLELYKQNDLEHFSLAAPAQPRSHHLSQTSQTSQPSLHQSDLSQCEAASLEEVEFSGLDMIGDVKGRRAHITLGCVGPVRPVQTGLDQLEVLRRLEKCEDLDTAAIQAGNLVSLGEGCWVVALTSPLSVASLFTGSY